MPKPNSPMPTNRRRRSCRSARSRGAVIVLALMGAFLMAGMIGYVFNTGRHAQLRQQTQNAADSTVISGSGYVARSFNTVAMNNVEISRLIAVVQLLDAVPLSVEYTLLDVRATLECVENQLDEGTGDRLGDDTLEEIAEDLREQEEKLVEMDQFFNQGSYDVAEMTFYDSDFGKGELWKAMESLDQISTATMEQLGELTQDTAFEAGQRNMGFSGGFSGVAPFKSGIVWKRYDFDDFRNPVVEGQLPDWVDDEVVNRGPYDAVFGWRHLEREYETIPNPGYQPPRETINPGSRWSGGLNGGGGQRNIVVGSEVVGYSTFGTWEWLGRILRNRVDSHEVLKESQFGTRVVRMGGNKLNYLWPGSARTWVFLDPEWITDYEQAVKIIAAGTPRVAYTQFVRMDYEQRFLNGSPVTPEDMTDWQIIRPRGGWSAVPGADKIRDHVWEDTASSKWETTTVVTDQFGNEKTIVNEHEIRYRWLFVWAGINVGPEVVIRDPNNFSSREDLAAPIDFDHVAMERPADGEVGMPGSPFTFLGFVSRANEPPMWTDLFNKSAYHSHTAIAQASVFNNHSWDLWTQMWHAQLEPVQEYDQWIALMKESINNDDITSSADLNQLLDYFESLNDLAPTMLNH